MLIYGIGAAASRLVVVFLVPLYTRTLSVDDYGQLEFLLAVHTGAVLLAGLQSESAVLRDYYAAREDGTLPQLSWASLLIAIAGSGGLIAATTLAAVVGWLDPVLAASAPLLLAATIAAQVFGIQLILLRFAGSAFRFALVSFLDLGVSALATVILMVVLDWGITGALWGMLVGKAIASLLVWKSTFGRWPGSPPDRALYRRMLCYSLPTMPSVLLNWLQTNGMRVLLAVFLTFQAVALAGVAIRISALFGFAVYSFRLAWERYAFRVMEDPARLPDAFNRVLEWYVVAFFAAAGAATLAAPLLVSIFAPPAYAASTGLVGTFVLGQFWLGIVNVTVIGIHGARRTGKLTHVFAIGAVANVGLLAVLSPVIGVTAAAVGFLASTMLTAAASTMYSERYYATGFSWRLLGAAGLASAACAAASIAIYGGSCDALTSIALRSMAFAAILLGAIAFLVLAGISAPRRGLMFRTALLALRGARHGTTPPGPLR